ncbi:FAD-dependent oxidoreductase [Paraglaciecola sp. Hal342]
MTHASSTRQIAIVGAGIMGRLLAWQLINRLESVTVTLFDKDPIDNGGAAAYTAAGMLAPYSELESAEFDVFEMGMASLARWPAVLSSINATVHPPLTLFSGGTLVVAHQQDMADFQRFYQHLVTKLPSVLLDDSAAHMQVLQQAQLQLLPRN